MEEFADAFSVGISSVEVIPIEDDIDYKAYAFTLYERVRKITQSKTTTNIVDEAIASTSTSKTSTVVSLPDDDSLESDIDIPAQSDDFKTVNFNNDTFIIPVFKKKKDLLEWVKVLQHHEKRLITTIHDASVLENTEEYREEAKRLADESRKMSFDRVKDKSKLEIYQKVVYILALERYVYNKIGSLAHACGNVKGRIDSNTGGLWISNVDKQHPAFSRLSTKRVTLNKIYRFDEYMTKNLVRVLFSKNPEIRAHAKLTLSSKTDPSKFSQILTNGGQVLESVCSEAGLTQDEILHLVFPKIEKGEEKRCISCDTAVNVSRTIYHEKCLTVRWLIDHCHFKYDEDERCLQAKDVMYLCAETRRRLNLLLHLHSQLNRDIVHKTDKDVVIWKRQKNGELVRSQLDSRSEDEIVGSSAWRQKHGLTPNRK